MDDGDRPLQVFISSRMRKNLARERAIVASEINTCGGGLFKAWRWEEDGVSGASEINLCKTAASESDGIVLLLANDVSPIVEAEFQAAWKSRALCFVFTKKTRGLTANCRRFVERLAKLKVTPLRFQNESELRSSLQTKLMHAVRRELRAQRRRR